MNTLINDIKRYAEDNYEYGYDSIVECWDDANYDNWINKYNVKSLNDFIKSYAFMIDYSNDIQSTAY